VVCTNTISSWYLPLDHGFYYRKYGMYILCFAQISCVSAQLEDVGSI